MSEDPIEFRSGDVNFYRYVGNNPIFFNDPKGNSIWGAVEIVARVGTALAAIYVGIKMIEYAIDELNKQITTSSDPCEKQSLKAEIANKKRKLQQLNEEMIFYKRLLQTDQPQYDYT